MFSILWIGVSCYLKQGFSALLSLLGWNSATPNLLGYIMVNLFFGLAKVYNKVTP